MPSVKEELIARMKNLSELRFVPYCIRHCDIQDSGDKFLVIGPCIVTNKTTAVKVDKRGFRLWLNGGHIQKVMPELSSDDAEFIMTGYSKEGWDLVFGEEDQNFSDFMVDRLRVSGKIMVSLEKTPTQRK